MNNLDQVILVDSQDQPIGTMDKVEAHRGQAHLHRAVSVYLFNSKSELLIQQRSAEKIVGAGQWANTCCGNLRPGESYENCAYRRLKEELGITNAKIKAVYKFEYHVQCNDEFSEWEMDQVFVGKYDGEVRLNYHEVKAVNYDFLTNVQGNIEVENYSPWFKLMITDGKLVNQMKAFNDSN